MQTLRKPSRAQAQPGAAAQALRAVIFGMLVVYCLKGVSLFSGSRGIPEALAILVILFLHRWQHRTLLSIAGGTLCYVLLVQLVF